jgi:hypothetical protein
VQSTVPPNSTETITYETTAPSRLGIYFVDYTLLDENGNIIQPQAEGERFCVSSPPNLGNHELRSLVKAFIIPLKS